MEIVLPSHWHFTQAWAGGRAGAGPGNRYRTAPRHVPPSSRYWVYQSVPSRSVLSSHPRVSHRPPQSVPSHPRVSLSHLFWSQDRPIVPPNFLHPIVPSSHLYLTIVPFLKTDRPIVPSPKTRSSYRPIYELHSFCNSVVFQKISR